ncbi:MAG: hypothetical protein SP1CHLAM54_03250 [Chlamydiia bacterium]|nr:hypothetical protein [Chlamydiia bacterium]MCH9615241.1 hypothetical protein [Chlamydiia bacterium]MCH9628437.1 hypothetical protein [Chlamydiia bacterium]
MNFESEETCCSVPQLLAGGVTMQILAVAAITREGSSKKGLRQLELFDELKEMNGPNYRLAIENASALIEETEELDLFIKRLDAVESPLYVSLTWNCENRFGGGNATDIGLKEDGKVVLEYLSENDIAIDFSHTSDALAWDILNEIDQKQLPLKVMASHSNFRSLQDHPRNLPDELAKEIIRRGGIIGINFIRRFIGEKKEDILAHFEHGLSLGGEDALCFGSDFYGGLNIPEGLLPGIGDKPFFEGFNNASKFPLILAMLTEKLGKQLVNKIASENYRRFNTVSPLLF